MLAASHRVRSRYPAEGSTERGTWAELLHRASGGASLDKGLKVKALLPVQVILTRAQKEAKSGKKIIGRHYPIFLSPLFLEQESKCFCSEGSYQ